MLHYPSSEQVAQNAYDAAEKVAYMWDDQIFLYEHKGIVSIGLSQMVRLIRLSACHTLIYMRLSTLIPRSSGNCALHFSKNVAILSPFLH
jgi:hypothetical protein